MDLSQLYSNPFLRIRSFKQRIDPQISAHSSEPLTSEDKLEAIENISPKRLNVYGETEVCRIRQKQKVFFLIIGLVLLSSIFTINKKAKFNLSKSVNERDLERIEAGLRGGSVEVGSNVFLIRDYLIFGGQRTIVYIKDIFEVIPEIVDHKTNQGLHWYYSFTVKIKAKDLEETEYTLFDTRISLTKDRIGIEKPYLINISCFLLLELHGTHGTISTDRIAKYYAKGGLWPELFRVFGMDFKPTSS